jgi:hypothetical protein
MNFKIGAITQKWYKTFNFISINVCDSRTPYKKYHERKMVKGDIIKNTENQKLVKLIPVIVYTGDNKCLKS